MHSRLCVVKYGNPFGKWAQAPDLSLLVHIGHRQEVVYQFALAAAAVQGMSPVEYEAQKVAVADDICRRLEALWPGLCASIEFREVRWRHTARLGGQPGQDNKMLGMQLACTCTQWFV